MNRVHTVFILLIYLFCSCAHKGDTAKQTPSIDSVNHVYHIPECNMIYRIPTPNTSIIADPTSLPPHLSMVIVDTMTNVSVLVAKVDKFPKTEEAAKNIVQLITNQCAPADYTVKYDHLIEKSQYNNEDSWSFVSSVDLIKQTDTVRVLYKGNILKNAAIVATMDNNHVNSFDIDKYIDGLEIEGER